MSTVKSAGSSVTVSLPCGGGPLPRRSRPEAAAAGAHGQRAHRGEGDGPAAGASAGALTGVLRVGRSDDGEVLVELDVDLAAVVQGHLDLVVALLVADLGARDPAAAGLGERGVAGPRRRRR